METLRENSISPALLIAAVAALVLIVAGLAWWFFGRSAPKGDYLPSAAAITSGRAAPPHVPAGALPPALPPATR